MEDKWINIRKKFKLSFEEEQKLWREFWIIKQGYFPDKVERVFRIVSFEKDNKESEKLNLEFAEFI